MVMPALPPWRASIQQAALAAAMACRPRALKRALGSEEGLQHLPSPPDAASRLVIKQVLQALTALMACRPTVGRTAWARLQCRLAWRSTWP